MDDNETEVNKITIVENNEPDLKEINDNRRNNEGTFVFQEGEGESFEEDKI